jgi:hypothetical protein
MKTIINGGQHCEHGVPWCLDCHSCDVATLVRIRDSLKERLARAENRLHQLEQKEALIEWRKAHE